MDTNALKNNMVLSINKYKTNQTAKSVYLLFTNAAKAMEITNELKLRLKNQFIGRCVTEGSCLTLLYFGKQLKIDVKLITSDKNNYEDLVEDFTQLNLSESNHFYLITDKTQVLLYK